MSQRLSSSFPGGPGRKAATPVEHVRSERIKRVEEIESRIAERRVFLERRARSHRVRAGLLFVVIVVAGVGLFFGLQRGLRSSGVDSERVVGDAASLVLPDAPASETGSER